MPIEALLRPGNNASPLVQRDQYQSPLKLDHLNVMLSEVGIWQHSVGAEPDVRHGYSIDDEARGLVVAVSYWSQGRDPEFMQRLGGTCFRFIREAAVSEGRQAGRYHNFCDTAGRWLDSIGSDDSFGRTLWGLGAAYAADAPFAPRAEAQALLEGSLGQIDTLQADWLRAKAFVALGLHLARLDDARLKKLADALADAYEATAGRDWQWYESHMTYCNARLPMALFAASEAFPHESRYRTIATQSLDFLLGVMRDARGNYSPIGNARLANAGWFLRGEARPFQWDQQPVDAGALVECCALAARVTGEARYAEAARAAFGWYLGENWHGLPVYDPQTGAVADSLHQHGVSRNLGAESVVSVHLAWQALQTIKP